MSKNDPTAFYEGEDVEEAGEAAYWQQNKEIDEEEEQSYDEWLQGEISFWGYTPL